MGHWGTEEHVYKVANLEIKAWIKSFGYIYRVGVQAEKMLRIHHCRGPRCAEA